MSSPPILDVTGLGLAFDALLVLSADNCTLIPLVT